MESLRQVQETILTDDDTYNVINRESPEVLDVYAEERRGYLMNDELLRPARVVVLS